MQRRIKWGIYILGCVLIFLLIEFKFLENHSWKPWNLPLSGKIIYLDPGHGGPDGGATKEGTQEKDIALNVAKKVRDYLQEQGALVILTRERDKDLANQDTSGLSRRKTEDLKKRLELINKSNADLFISIHLNSIPSPQWRGAQTFFSPHYKENKKIAKLIQDELVLNLENTTRLAKAIDHVYILRYAKKPGALVEIGFLSNHEEREQLKKEDYQEKIAASIYKGVLRYFTE
jgi:N-acetylmuramoyl-L-alanine amidase